MQLAPRSNAPSQINPPERPGAEGGGRARPGLGPYPAFAALLIAVLALGVWLSTVLEDLHLPPDARFGAVGLVPVPGDPVTAADALRALRGSDPARAGAIGHAVALGGGANEAWFEVLLPKTGPGSDPADAADMVLEVSPPWLERVSLVLIESEGLRVLGGALWVYGEPGAAQGRIDARPILKLPDAAGRDSGTALLLQVRSHGPLMVSARLMSRNQAVLRGQGRTLLAGLLCGALVILLGCTFGLMLTSGSGDFSGFGVLALMLAGATILIGTANGLVPLLLGAGFAELTRRGLEVAMCAACGAGILVAARWSGAHRDSPRVARYSRWAAGAQFAAAAGSAAGAFAALQPAVLALHTASIVIIVGIGVVELRARTSLERLNLVMLAAQVGFQSPVKFAFAGLSAPGPMAFHGWQLGTVCVAIVVFNSLAGMMREAERSRRLRARCELLQARLDAEERSSAESRDMIRMLSHELRTPLATLCVLARNAERQHPEVSELSQAMLVQARRAADLLERVVSGESLPELLGSRAQAPTAAARATREAVAEARLNWPNRSVLVRTALPDRVMVGASPEAVRLVLMNLVENALRHAGPSARVDVEVRGRADRVEFVVSDDGVGIPSEDCERIFRRYWRGRGAMATPGVGLGLWLVQRAVESVGGQVRFQPSATGGSVFTVALPVADAGAGREGNR